MKQFDAKEYDNEHREKTIRTGIFAILFENGIELLLVGVVILLGMAIFSMCR